MSGRLLGLTVGCSFTGLGLLYDIAISCIFAVSLQGSYRCSLPSQLVNLPVIIGVVSYIAGTEPVSSLVMNSSQMAQ